MRILVAVASKHGGTREIAERIGAMLGSSGHQVDIRDAGDVDPDAGYDAFVLGSATYMGHWRGEALELARRLETVAAGRPVWLFSSGPLGTHETDAQGRDMRASAEPRELPELMTTLSPREHRVFFGALDPKRLSRGERAMRILPAARQALPEGDFRDWAEIDAWGASIRDQLATARR